MLLSSAGYVWYVGSFKLCCEILLLLNVAESAMDRDESIILFFSPIMLLSNSQETYQLC